MLSRTCQVRVWTTPPNTRHIIKGKWYLLLQCQAIHINIKSMEKGYAHKQSQYNTYKTLFCYTVGLPFLEFLFIPVRRLATVFKLDKGHDSIRNRLFSFTGELLIGPRKVYNYIESGRITSLPREIAPR